MPEIVLKPENIAEFVYFMRGEKVMLDADLAMLYGVKARVLNQAVARNRQRFPSDFMFQLSKDEFGALKSQIVISKPNASLPASTLRSQFVTSNTRRRRSALSSLRFHRAGRRHALQHLAQLPRIGSEYRHHANLCAIASPHGLQSRSCSQNRVTREKIR